jgi:hypothetical protein
MSADRLLPSLLLRPCPTFSGDCPTFSKFCFFHSSKDKNFELSKGESSVEGRALPVGSDRALSCFTTAVAGADGLSSVFSETDCPFSVLPTTLETSTADDEVVVYALAAVSAEPPPVCVV